MRANVYLHSRIRSSVKMNQSMSYSPNASTAPTTQENINGSIPENGTFLIPHKNHSSISYKATERTMADYGPVTQSHCDTKTNLAFIKTHKTGSTTLRSIINRFGLSRNLSFVFLKESKNGHVPYYRLTDSLRKRFLPPVGVRSGNPDHLRGYNISNVHLRFSRKFFDTFMANGTKYITILRDPVHQWLSVVSFFGMKRYLPFDTRRASFETIATSLAVNAKELRKKMKNANRYYFQNNQIFDLGLSDKNCMNETAVFRYVNYLSGQFDLVLINEYFDESLVLLRKLMCWNWDDIVYTARNIQSRRHSVKNGTINQLIRRNNFADQYLYDFFNKTLWAKIEEYGKDFYRDLEYFRRLSANVYDECSLKDVVVKGRVHHTFKNHSSRFCVEVQADNQLPRIRERQQVTTEKKGGKTQEQIQQSGKQSMLINDRAKSQNDKKPNAVDVRTLLEGKLGRVAITSLDAESKRQEEARLACEKDPNCQKVVFEKQKNGKIRMLKFMRRRKNGS